MSIQWPFPSDHQQTLPESPMTPNRAPTTVQSAPKACPMPTHHGPAKCAKRYVKLSKYKNDC